MPDNATDVNGLTDGNPVPRYDQFTRGEMGSSLDTTTWREHIMTGISKDTRQQIERLRQRAETDPALARAMQDDPRQTLSANGIDTSGLTFGGGEVSGYMRKELPDNCFCLWHDIWGECTVSFCL